MRRSERTGCAGWHSVKGSSSRSPGAEIREPSAMGPISLVDARTNAVVADDQHFGYGLNLAAV